MRLAHETNLLLLWLIPLVLAVFVYAVQARKKIIRRLGDSETLRQMMLSVSGGRRVFKLFLLLIVLFLTVFALARPQWGQKQSELVRRGRDIFVAVDTSLSMLAQDIRPSRIQEAKRRLRQLTEILEGDRIGLIAFAGEAFVLCPLTLDYGGARMALDAVDVGVIPQEGTNVVAAINHAVNSFVQGERKYKVLILITDGENWEGDPLEAARAAAQAGVKIYCVGIGSLSGEPIPEYDEQGRQVGFYKYKGTDEPVMTRLDEKTLQKIALATDGVYYRAASDGIAIEKIYADIKRMETKELESRKLVLYEDRFTWFLFPALLLLVLETMVSERRPLRRTGRVS
jgi:Ca-activated chloride channel homolog